MPSLSEDALRQIESNLLSVLKSTEQMLEAMSDLSKGKEKAEQLVGDCAETAITKLTSACTVIAAQATSLQDYASFERSTLESQAKCEAALVSLKHIEASILKTANQISVRTAAPTSTTIDLDISADDFLLGTNDEPPHKRAKRS